MPPSLKSLGRRAGILYFLSSIPAPFALIIVPSRLYVRGDVAATGERVREHASLLRTSVALEVWQCVLLVFAALAVYRFLREVDRYLAVLTAALMLAAVPIEMVNLVNHLAALLLIGGTSYAAAFTREQLDGLVYFFLQLHGKGLIVAQIFWGLWLFPWGLAAVRTGVMPRWIGVALILAGTGYVLASAVDVLAPAIAPVVIPFLLALGVGELIKAVFLIGWGAREPDSESLRPANI